MIWAMESRILRKYKGIVFFTRKASKKLVQFHDTTENEKNGKKIENTEAKGQEIFTFSDGEMGMKFWSECTQLPHLEKQIRKNN